MDAGMSIRLTHSQAPPPFCNKGGVAEQVLQQDACCKTSEPLFTSLKHSLCCRFFFVTEVLFQFFL
uniref:Uncharacterized protein n=1 Tax=Aegilops tauschii subsp. strangulata TaxID=200361 RepID=A0A453CDE5_AEGTS